MVGGGGVVVVVVSGMWVVGRWVDVEVDVVMALRGGGSTTLAVGSAETLLRTNHTATHTKHTAGHQLRCWRLAFAVCAHTAGTDRCTRLITISREMRQRVGVAL